MIDPIDVVEERLYALEPDDMVIMLASELYERGGVRFVDPPEGAELPADALVYHLNEECLPGVGLGVIAPECPLVTGAFPLRNGVILGQGHSDLCCSEHACQLGMCPVALAACFEAYAEARPGYAVPFYVKYDAATAKRRQAAEAFRAKWAARTDGSDEALSLLCSLGENDFAGLLVINDDSYASELVDDLGALLAALGKIDKGAVRQVNMISLLTDVNLTSSCFNSTGNADFAPRTLHVFKRPADLATAAEAGGLDVRLSCDFIYERLGNIVDGRYVLVMGSEADLAGFVGANPRFLLTFDRHRITPARMELNELYERYAGDLVPELGKQALANDKFREQFRSYVAFNADALPFAGAELADFLAKHANAAGELCLPRSRYLSSSLEEMLDSIVGLKQVKRTIRQLEYFAVFRKIAQNSGRELPQANMHMVFTGNPGTGKTTVARMIATMLYKIGIIRQNKCIEVTSKDLIGKYVGHTDKQTSEVIQRALGGILFIDEAYALAPSGENTTSFGREAIAELVKEMEDHRDDLIVIFAGYEKEMADFIELNPGLASRIGYTFRFEDFSTDELLEIFRRRLAEAGFEYDATRMDAELREIFESQRRFKSFGNGRFVDTLVQRATVKHAERLAEAEAAAEDGAPELAVERFQLDPEDIPTRRELFDASSSAARSADEMLEPLVGIEDLKKQVRALEKTVRFYDDARRAGKALPRLNLHMVFTGNPGTGKTTVARIIGSILYNVGIVPTGKFVEVEATDLAAVRFNSEDTALDRALRDAMGGVLFIDEAYALLYQARGSEIIAGLVKAMEDHKGELVVMFAGYRNEMRQFIDLNPGLASRVGYTFDFEDYKPGELLQIFDRKMEAAGFDVDAPAREAAEALFKYFHNVENFGNGRFVDKLVQEIIVKHACNVEGEATFGVAADDVPSVEDMCKIVSMPVYEPSDVSGDDARRRVALHEMGHALCRLVLTGGTDIVVITIEQEGNGALGYVQHKAQAAALPTATHLKNRIAELMGGMAAEQLAFGEYSAGNSSDLRMATRVAADYVGRYGMSGAGFVQFFGDDGLAARGPRLDVSALPEQALEAMNKLMGEAFELAQQVIREHQVEYDRLVEALLEAGTISGERITELWAELTGGKGDE